MCFHWFFLLWTHFARTVCVDPSLLGKKEDDEDRMPGIDLNRLSFFELGLSAWSVSLSAYHRLSGGGTREKQISRVLSFGRAQLLRSFESHSFVLLCLFQSLFPRIFEESFEALAEREKRCDSCTCSSKQGWGVVLRVGKLCKPTRDFLKRLSMSRSLQNDSQSNQTWFLTSSTAKPCKLSD